MSETCEHGQPMWPPWPEGLAWSGGIGVCRCCRAWVFYIASSSMVMKDDGGDWRSTQPDQNLCDACGGKPMQVHVVGDDVKVYDPGSHGPETYDPAYLQERADFHVEERRLIRDGDPTA